MLCVNEVYVEGYRMGGGWGISPYLSHMLRKAGGLTMGAPRAIAHTVRAVMLVALGSVGGGAPFFLRAGLCPADAVLMVITCAES